MLRTIRVREILLACALLICSASIARAGGGTTRVNDVLVTANNKWPVGQLKGYQPVSVELVNESASPRRVVVSLQAGWQSRDRVEQEFKLEGNARLDADLIVPTFAVHSHSGFWNGEYSLETTSGGERGRIHGICGGGGPARKSVMIFTKRRLLAGTIESWAATFSIEQDPFSAVAEWMQRRSGIFAAGELALGAAVFEQMPTRHEAYTSLDCVVIDSTVGLPSAERLGPLLAYVRLGGSVVFLGEGAVEKVSKQAVLEPWLEERFGSRLIENDLTEIKVYNCGLGLIAASETSDDLFEEESTQLNLLSILTKTPSLTPSSGRWREFPMLAIPGVEDLPYGVFIFLLICFAIIIGPVNFILVRRSGKPAMLLLTIPVISLIASLLLLGYGVFYQGIDTKSSSITLTLLDQRAERVDVIEDRRTFVGLATESGLRPEAGTACIAYGARGEGTSFAMEFGESTLLSGSFYESRQETSQRLLSERSSRLRVTLEEGTNGLRATNGLTCGLRGFFLRDTDGSFWASTETMPPGAGVDLELISDELDIRKRQTNFFELYLDSVTPPGDELLPGTYFALLEENIFQDDCGLELNELAGLHGIMGILDLGDFR